MGYNESIVPHSDSDTPDIEALSVGSSDISSDHTDLGNGQDDNRPNTHSDATVAANANIPNWTTSFTYKKIESCTQDSGPYIPENFDVSVATALDYLTYYSNEKYLVT